MKKIKEELQDFLGVVAEKALDSLAACFWAVFVGAGFTSGALLAIKLLGWVL